MTQPEDPIDVLIKRLDQLHEAQIEMKGRQVTTEDSKRMEQTLKANTKAAEDLKTTFRNLSNSINVSVMQATGSLSRIERLNRKDVDDLQKDYRRKTWIFALFAAILGVMLGVVLGILTLDYHNTRTFQNGLHSIFGEQICKQAGGNTVTVKETGERLCTLVIR